ncbi:MAG TPA: hypothetical protein VH561_17140 [Micromonosporaceae bacterium]
MNVELIVALASTVVSLLAALFSARANQRARELDYQLEQRKKADDAAAVAQRILHQYRDPLLDAAQTLQSRTYNILINGYLGRFLHCGDADEERYARDYTVFALAEYLTWVEIVRREVRFLDVGDEEHNRQLMTLLTQTQLTIQSDKLAGPFRIFRGHQRAIAELMMVPTGAPEGPRNECLGFAAFCDRLDEDEDFRAWFRRLREQVDLLVTRDHDERMTQLQNDLVDIIDHLDPRILRIPQHFRQRAARRAADGIPAQPAR